MFAIYALYYDLYVVESVRENRYHHFILETSDTYSSSSPSSTTQLLFIVLLVLLVLTTVLFVAALVACTLGAVRRRRRRHRRTCSRLHDDLVNPGDTDSTCCCPGGPWTTATTGRCAATTAWTIDGELLEHHGGSGGVASTSDKCRRPCCDCRDMQSVQHGVQRPSSKHDASDVGPSCNCQRRTDDTRQPRTNHDVDAPPVSHVTPRRELMTSSHAFPVDNGGSDDAANVALLSN